jgi:hypothetical protein
MTSDSVQSANRSDDAAALLLEFVRTWDQQSPRAEEAAVTPLLMDLNRLIRRARAQLGREPTAIGL